ncbi:hypothetical protein K9N68_02160 [Kovacikia minuta CCNUW1]|uniref:hypothetical protein n=1 Tax=Kovacikia minuta TaxID=2931930 RepID=UPI001CCD68E7|nr:hypothetical protein [Kovacikia minuta]UBF26820.1 hypothetical protein K9N68_02160 [Kovacikia minuta CCNUW1]
MDWQGRAIGQFVIAPPIPKPIATSACQLYMRCHPNSEKFSHEKFFVDLSPLWGQKALSLLPEYWSLPENLQQEFFGRYVHSITLFLRMMGVLFLALWSQV